MTHYDSDHVFTTTFTTETFDGCLVEVTLVNGLSATGGDESSARAEGQGFCLRLASSRAGSNFRHQVELADHCEVLALFANILDLPGCAGSTFLLTA